MNRLVFLDPTFVRASHFFLFVIWCLLQSSPALACPKKMPEGLTGISVGKNLSANGLMMDVTQVESREGAKVVIQRTEKMWKDEGYKVKRNSAAGWEIVSALEDKCMVTLQLTSRHGAFGYLTRSTPGKLSVATPASMDAPIPGDANVTSTVASDDDGRNGLIMSLTSSRSIEDLKTFFMRHLKDEKWEALRSQAVKRKTMETDSITISAQRGRKQIEIVIWPERETQIVMAISEAL